MKKKYLSLVLSGLMIAGSLTACGNVDSFDKGQNDTIVDIFEYQNSWGISLKQIGSG